MNQDKISASSDMSRSVRRLIRLYELFEVERRPLTSIEIMAALDAPRSSVANLLKALAELNMLTADRKTATYFPSARFAQLGSWILNTWLPSQEFLDMMNSLRDTTVETVVLSTPTDIEMEVVHAVGGLGHIALVVQPGQRFPLWASAVGSAYLATQPSSLVTALTKRVVTRGLVKMDDPYLTNLAEDVRRSRDQGFAVAYGSIVPDVGVVAMAVPAQLAPRPLVISVGGPADRIKRVEKLIVDHLRSFLRNVEKLEKNPPIVS
ncbi:IclR family transcriptional regulator [Govanella unica]|uniref:Helix-turn-helix domain-containing protein n=1 Tax=Govanella unica TaxID=2975056 RepID=A0A9X3TZF9_9PROT|nr:IclR family transcriptional regulator C-terminal domain-containing protein [Govania unica]MDA5194423.1 helix-turn-helix domain-containing protein [Govania unica]